MAPCFYRADELVDLKRKCYTTIRNMTDKKDIPVTDPEVASILEDFLADPYQSQKKPKPSTEPTENVYFLLDLKLPDFTKKKQLDAVSEDRSPKNEPSKDVGKFRRPVKYGFLEMLESIHGRDFRTNNPWFNPEVAANRLNRNKKRRKQVRFSTTEISPAFMPHCRRKDFSNFQNGQLHAPSCRNAVHETVEVLGDHAWHNRVFILESCVKRPSDTSDFYRESPEPDHEQGFYERSAENNPDDMNVFDSVELRKLQLSRNTHQDTETSDICDDSLHHKEDRPSRLRASDNNPSEHNSLSPDAHSDDSITSISTLKPCDSEVHFQPETPLKSADADSAFGDGHVFEMFEPPRFKNPSDSDYCSETKSDTESDIDLDDYMNQVSASNAPIHQMWFINNDTELPSSSKDTRDITPTTTPFTTYRTPWSGCQTEQIVEVKPDSVIGRLLSPPAIQRKVLPQLGQTDQLISFMFDSPSPDDIVKMTQGSVFSKAGPSRKYI